MSGGDGAGAPAPAAVFSALGDQTRLSIVSRLGRGRPLSIVELTRGACLTRQGVSKHLRVLEEAGVVRRARFGREARFALSPRGIAEARAYLDRVSEQWDEAVERLKRHVEDEPEPKSTEGDGE